MKPVKWRCFGCSHPTDWLCLQIRRGARRARWIDMESGQQLGPEQANVVPAIAWAYSAGLLTFLGDRKPREAVRGFLVELILTGGAE